MFAKPCVSTSPRKRSPALLNPLWRKESFMPTWARWLAPRSNRPALMLQILLTAGFLPIEIRNSSGAFAVTVNAQAVMPH